ncbi:neutral zinc metallopeptidase [Kibdelosporangium aridum]|uniref:neutral zinc metallopeptidase n=1 Tax=Kibdelosporangium aridum TaxID=2030 RepID=UPI000524AE93
MLRIITAIAAVATVVACAGQPAAPKVDLPVSGGDGGAIDKLAADAVADVQAFWQETFPSTFNGEFTPVRRLVSYDSTGASQEFCGAKTAGVPNAFYCPADDSIAWDRGELLPMLSESFGEASVVAVLAHEIGHAVQLRLGDRPGTPTIVREQQADCYTGAYFRWTTDGNSRTFKLDAGQGLNPILSTLFFIRDAVGSDFDAQGAHGSAFDRVTAFQFGFSEGPARCARIDIAEISRRSTQQKFSPDERDVGLGKGNIRVDDAQAQEQLIRTLRAAFPRSQPTVTRARARCADAPLTSPVAYCPSTNVISLSMQDLVKIGTPPRRGREGGIGDFAAFAEIASRYMLSVQQSAGLTIEGPAAAQRTACLTGTWAATIVSGSGAALELSPGDLDEAVAEMLAPKSLIAADVKGASASSGFDRVEAFRDGFLRSADTCLAKYR